MSTRTVVLEEGSFNCDPNGDKWSCHRSENTSNPNPYSQIVYQNGYVSKVSLDTAAADIVDLIASYIPQLVYLVDGSNIYFNEGNVIPMLTNERKCNGFDSKTLNKSPYKKNYSDWFTEPGHIVAIFKSGAYHELTKKSLFDVVLNDLKGKLEGENSKLITVVIGLENQMRQTDGKKNAEQGELPWCGPKVMDPGEWNHLYCEWDDVFLTLVNKKLDEEDAAKKNRRLILSGDKKVLKNKEEIAKALPVFEKSALSRITTRVFSKKTQAYMILSKQLMQYFCVQTAGNWICTPETDATLAQTYARTTSFDVYDSTNLKFNEEPVRSIYFRTREDTTKSSTIQRFESFNTLLWENLTTAGKALTPEDAHKLYLVSDARQGLYEFAPQYLAECYKSPVLVTGKFSLNFSKNVNGSVEDKVLDDIDQALDKLKNLTNTYCIVTCSWQVEEGEGHAFSFVIHKTGNNSRVFIFDPNGRPQRLGTSWYDVGGKPTDGRILPSPTGILGELQKGKLSFREEDFNKLNIPNNLMPTDYVEAGGKYFRPDGRVLHTYQTFVNKYKEHFPSVNVTNPDYFLGDLIRMGRDVVMFDINGGICKAMTAWMSSMLILNPRMTPENFAEFIQIRQKKWSRMKNVQGFDDSTTKLSEIIKELFDPLRDPKGIDVILYEKNKYQNLQKFDSYCGEYVEEGTLPQKLYNYAFQCKDKLNRNVVSQNTVAQMLPDMRWCKDVPPPGTRWRLVPKDAVGDDLVVQASTKPPEFQNAQLGHDVILSKPWPGIAPDQPFVKVGDEYFESDNGCNPNKDKAMAYKDYYQSLPTTKSEGNLSMIFTDWLEVQVFMFMQYVIELRTSLFDYPISRLRYKDQILTPTPTIDPNKRVLKMTRANGVPTCSIGYKTGVVQENLKDASSTWMQYTDTPEPNANPKCIFESTGGTSISVQKEAQRTLQYTGGNVSVDYCPVGADPNIIGGYDMVKAQIQADPLYRWTFQIQVKTTSEISLPEVNSLNPFVHGIQMGTELGATPSTDNLKLGGAFKKKTLRMFKMSSKHNVK